MKSIMRENRTFFKDWVWRFIWCLEDSYYTMKDLPGIALEADAMLADPDNEDMRTYIDYVVVMDESNIFVHMPQETRH